MWRVTGFSFGRLRTGWRGHRDGRACRYARNAPLGSRRNGGTLTDSGRTLAIHVPYDTIPQLLRFRPQAIVSGELGLRTFQASVFRWIARRSRLVIWATLSEITEQGRGWLRPFCDDVLLRSADAVIVNGHSGSRYVRRFGVDAEQIFRFHKRPSWHPSSKMLIDRPERIATVSLLGRLIEFKGLLPFVANLAEWCRPPDPRNIRILDRRRRASGSPFGVSCPSVES